jgi:hypothetical protein
MNLAQCALTTHERFTIFAPIVKTPRLAPYKLRFSQKADKLDFDRLTVNEQSQLTEGIEFNSSEHDLYRFFVAPDFKRRRDRRAAKNLELNLGDVAANSIQALWMRLIVFQRQFAAWQKKIARHQLENVSYLATDAISVRARSPSPEIRFVGVSPKTMLSDGQVLFDYEYSNSGTILQPLPWGGLVEINAASKKAGKKLNKRNFAVFSARTDDRAFWIFCEQWIKSSFPTRMQLMVAVSKAIKPKHRFIECDAEAFVKSRRIEPACTYDKKILLPA